MLIVQKYGGKTLDSPERIKRVAQKIARVKKEGHSLIVVVSAMGPTTDELLNLASKVSNRPNRREMDMLLTAGERISMALLSMALHDLNCPAISFTGSQAGIMTTGSHNQAFITELRPIRVTKALEDEQVAVLAGFQGVHPESKEVTTLGRGGSDTTAVALAAHFKADRCEILKDVDGLYSADPKKVSTPRHYQKMSFEQIQSMCFWGAQLLHYRSVELARRLKVPLWIGSAEATPTGDRASLIKSGTEQASPISKNCRPLPNQKRETRDGPLKSGEISDAYLNSKQMTQLIEEDDMFETPCVLGVNSHKLVQHIQIRKPDTATAYETLSLLFTKHKLSWPQVLASSYDDESQSCRMMITADPTHLNELEALAKQNNTFSFLGPASSSITLNTYGSVGTDFIHQGLQHLKTQGITVSKILSGPGSISYFVSPANRDQAIKILHSRFVEGERPT